MIVSLVVLTFAMTTRGQDLNNPCVKREDFSPRYGWDSDLSTVFPGCSQITTPCISNTDGSYTCRVNNDYTTFSCGVDTNTNCIFPRSTDMQQCHSHITLQASTACNTYNSGNAFYASPAQYCIVAGASDGCWWTAYGCLATVDQCGANQGSCQFATSFGNCEAAQCDYTGENNIFQGTCHNSPTLNNDRQWLLNYHTEGFLYGTYAGQWTTNTADANLECGATTMLGSSGTTLEGISVRCCDTASDGKYTCYSEAYNSGSNWYYAAQLYGVFNNQLCDLNTKPAVVCASAASVRASWPLLLALASLVAAQNWL